MKAKFIYYIHTCIYLRQYVDVSIHYLTYMFLLKLKYFL